MTATMTQGVYLNIPRADWTLLQELVNRFGWQSETREFDTTSGCNPRECQRVV